MSNNENLSKTIDPQSKPIDSLSKTIEATSNIEDLRRKQLLHYSKPLIRHRAGRHQWNVSNALVRLPVLGSLDLFLKDHRNGPKLSGKSRVTFLTTLCWYVFQSPYFAILASKNIPKRKQNRVKIDEQIMSVAILKKSVRKCTKIFDFPFVCQEADVPKT